MKGSARNEGYRAGEDAEDGDCHCEGSGIAELVRRGGCVGKNWKGEGKYWNGEDKKTKAKNLAYAKNDDMRSW